MREGGRAERTGQALTEAWGHYGFRKGSLTSTSKTRLWQMLAGMSSLGNCARATAVMTKLANPRESHQCAVLMLDSW